LAGRDGAEAFEAAAKGEPINAILHRLAPKIHPEVYRRLDGDLRWHFMRQG